MDIVSRRSHSRPSSYTKLGLDATVAYPRVDLQLRNPFPFTLVVHAHTPEPGLLKVELLGGEAVKEVKYSYGISSIESYVRRISVKKFLKAGRKFRKQKGTRGMDVHSTVTIHYKSGKVLTKRYYSGYRATPEVYWVAPMWPTTPCRRCRRTPKASKASSSATAAMSTRVTGRGYPSR